MQVKSLASNEMEMATRKSREQSKKYTARQKATDSLKIHCSPKSNSMVIESYGKSQNRNRESSGKSCSARVPASYSKCRMQIKLGDQNADMQNGYRCNKLVFRSPIKLLTGDQRLCKFTKSKWQQTNLLKQTVR